jgi:hypothetical protein
MKNDSNILYSKDPRLDTGCTIHELIHRTELPEDSCGFQPKHVAAIKQLVQLVGERRVYKTIARKMYNIKFTEVQTLCLPLG